MLKLTTHHLDTINKHIEGHQVKNEIPRHRRTFLQLNISIHFVRVYFYNFCTWNYTAQFIVGNVETKSVVWHSHLHKGTECCCATSHDFISFADCVNLAFAANGVTLPETIFYHTVATIRLLRMYCAPPFLGISRAIKNQTLFSHPKLNLQKKTSQKASSGLLI
jgi:hypothetical protein